MLAFALALIKYCWVAKCLEKIFYEKHIIHQKSGSSVNDVTQFWTFFNLSYFGFIQKQNKEWVLKSCSKLGVANV